MKVGTIALAFASCATAAPAYAANSSDTTASSYDSQQTHQWAPVHASAKAKLRAEVHQELVRADKESQLAALNKLYPGG